VKKIPSKNFRVGSKYLQMIRDYFGDMEIYDPFHGCDAGIGYLNLIKSIAPMFNSCMTEDDVDYLVYRAVCKIEAQHMGNALEGDLQRRLEVADEVIACVVEALESYPRDYEFRMSLPGFSKLPVGRYQLHESIWLEFVPDQERKANLLINARGFWREGVENSIVADCLRKSKIFSYLMHVGPLTKPQIKFRNSVAEFRDLKTLNVYDFILPEGMAQLVGSISLNMTSLFSSVKKRTYTEEDFAASMEIEARDFRKYFATLDAQDNSRIATAIEWYEDARAVSNQTVALLEVCIGLEALLGEEGNMADMTNRLCDRFAFTLGKSPGERSHLFAQYKTLLSVRGKLVHAKIARLDTQGSVVLGGAYGMLQRLISHELKLAIV